MNPWLWLLLNGDRGNTIFSSPRQDDFLSDAVVHNLNFETVPDVDVIIGTFNQVEYVTQAIRSVEAQDFNGRVRIIIHDDASTDGTQELLWKLASEVSIETSLVLQRRNVYSKGLFHRIPLIRLSRARFIANLDGDDFWISTDKLSQQIQALQANQSASLAFHSACVVDGTSRVVRHAIKHRAARVRFNEDLAFRNPIPSPTVLLRRSAMPSWIDDMTGLDWTLWAAFMLRGSGVELDSVEAAYRETPGSQSNWDRFRIEGAMLSDLAVLARKSKSMSNLMWRYSLSARKLRHQAENRLGKTSAKGIYAIAVAPGLALSSCGSALRVRGSKLSKLSGTVRR